MPDIAKHAMVALECGGSVVSEIDPASVRLSPNLQREIQQAGALNPQIALQLTAEPVVEFTCHNIKLASVPALLSALNPLTLFFRALTDSFGFGSGWITMGMAVGMIEPVTLEGSRGQIASLQVRVHPVSSDGDASPVTVGTSSDTIPAPSNYFTLGGVTLGSALSGVQSFSLNFGYNVVKNAGENGHPYPTQAYIDGQAATLSTTVEDLSEATQARLMQGGSETTVTAAFRKLNEAAIPVDSGGYQVTAQKAAVHVPTVSGGRPSTVELNADLIATAFDGTNYLQFADVA